MDPSPVRASWRPLLRRWALTAVAGVGLQVGALVVVGLGEEVAPGDCAVVLGARVRPDGRPSTKLRDRLERARRLFADGLVGHVIVSGGLGVEGHDEALVMADWLAGHGVPRERIVVDREGWTTAHTARNAAALMQARGLRSVIVVSSWFHVPRVRLAFARAGCADVGWARAALRPAPRDLWSVPREVAGLWSYALRDAAAFEATASEPALDDEDP